MNYPVLPLPASVFEKLFGESDKLTTGQTAIFLVLALLIAYRGVYISMKYRKKYDKKYVYKRRKFTSSYTRTGARTEDDDIPSGFGGPSGYGWIKKQNQDEYGDGDSD